MLAMPVLCAADSLYVVDPDLDALFLVDTDTGNRTIVSSSSVGSGPNFGFPLGLSFDLAGDILVIERGVGSSVSRLFKVDPSTGEGVNTLIGSGLASDYAQARTGCRYLLEK